MIFVAFVGGPCGGAIDSFTAGKQMLVVVIS
jgi:hypothetical protein